MKTSELVEFYNNYFLPIYADVVAILADKPQQIIFEIENTFSHLMVALDTKNSSIVQEENIKKAYGHLLRCTLDAYKILWTEMSTYLDNIMKDEQTRAFSFNKTDGEVLSSWNNFKNKAQTARKQEMSSVGKNQIDTIALYKETIDEGRFLMDNFDPDKYNSAKSSFSVTQYKNHFIGFLLGCLASYIVTVITEPSISSEENSSKAVIKEIIDVNLFIPLKEKSLKNIEEQVTDSNLSISTKIKLSEDSNNTN